MLLVDDLLGAGEMELGSEAPILRVLNKMDLLPHLRFDLSRAVENAREVNPGLRFFFTSATTGEGMDSWYEFLREQVRACVPA